MIISVLPTFQRILFIVFLLMIIQSCEWAEDQPIAIYESMSSTPIPDAKANEGGDFIEKKLFWKAYAFGVDLNSQTINIEGIDFSIQLEKKANGINGTIAVEIPEDYVFTEVYNSRMDIKEEADRLAF